MDEIFHSDVENTKRLLEANLPARICIHEAGHYVYAVKAKDNIRGFKIDRVSLGNFSNNFSNGGYAGGVDVNHDLVGDADVLEFLLSGSAAEAVVHGARRADQVAAGYLHPTASRGGLTKAIERRYDIKGFREIDRDIIFNKEREINTILARVLSANGDQLIALIVDNLDLLKTVAAYFYNIGEANRDKILHLQGVQLRNLPR